MSFEGFRYLMLDSARARDDLPGEWENLFQEM